ncbi:MAG: bifunctional 23S rRNA (guanine(2069)-N(7))-methyltransferase RlmK/23S rRNA (guanine(2445)-N(2))-methyltransferase RlmL [Actinobacteria bacterium]|nr:bifunctional 23S rRNA (guanine(2069)-N(7))-methyltransferase RlmK/23S rRNA (guanine(2445)-N(2))-methyltransferase RlmL [Actinomycetota bacterium]
MKQFEFYAPCPRGLEGVCAEELRAMRIGRVRPLKSGVAFFGTLEQAYRAALWVRTASRILLVLARVGARDADELYQGIRSIPWEEHMLATGTLAIDANGVNDELRNTQFTGVRVKDAICDHFRARDGMRPDVDTERPDIRVNVALRGEKATVSIDLAGESLHRRGYRAPGKQVEAPLKEALAAGILLLSSWDEIAKQGGAFLDPLCGSGTLAIEAAMIAADIAPGILRDHWGFDGWLGHEAGVWGRLLDEADDRAQRGRESMPPIYASDHDPYAIALAAESAKRALLGHVITFSVSDVAVCPLPPLDPPGLVATNPPYGERISTQAQLPALYAAISSRFRSGFDGFTMAIITSDALIDAGLGMRSERVLSLYNGKIESPLHLYTLGAASMGEEGTPSGVPLEVGGTTVYVAEQNTEQFVARFKKVYALRKKWARKNGVSCYRIYDADLPDYSVAIDLYQGAGRDEGKTWVHVAEYAPPKDIDPVRAQRRLADILAVLPAALDVSSEDIFLKVRRRARGGSQYGQLGSGRSVIGTILENHLGFEINLSDYLDTGIFLDHRLTRGLILAEADKARFLNLFAYTGTATVHAAAGGAFTTTTVDMSQTYLSWAERNMKKNGFTGENHEYVRADCLQWIQDMRHSKNRWDLIFIDPPTFSNSTKMVDGDWDVQRDHAELLVGVSRLLTRTGSAIFSCNLRNFKPDYETLSKAGVELVDITPQTIPVDFERNPKIHHCYRMRRV